ncbi:MAG: hypothetical protein KBD37_00465 [Burkholderiales bacterium]|nr:hypothetical protein [Burkholderiales bacterium]
MKKTLLVILYMGSSVSLAATQGSQPVKNKLAPNNPLAGSHQQSSEQQFGTPAVAGKKGQKYNYSDASQNNPLAGSYQQSSEQQFGTQPITGNPGVKPKSHLTPETANNPTVGGRQSSSDQLFGNPGDPTND